MKPRAQQMTPVQPDFGHWLEQQMETVAKYGWQILAAAAAAVALVIAGYFYWQTQHDRQAVAWSTYLAAMAARERPQALQQVVTEYSDTEVGGWAQLSLGDANVTLAAADPTRSVFANRDEALKLLDSAAASYSKVLSTARNPALVSRARFGLARVHETRCQPEEAIKLYNEVAAAERDSELGKAAAKAAKRLESPVTQEFMKWFVTFKPVKPAPGPAAAPIPGINTTPIPDTPDIAPPGLTPPAAPSEPELKFPDLGNPGKPAEKPAGEKDK